MNEQNQSSLSLGQQRRLERKKAAIKLKKVAKRNKIIGWCTAGVITVALVGLIGFSVYKNVTKVKPNNNYSAQLDNDGTIMNVTASNLVTLPEYKGITVPSSTVEVSEETIDTLVKSTVLGFATLDKTAGYLIEDGDKVNIDYVGKIDGVEFEGGNSNGAGSDLTIGSNQFIDDFEQQLIGKSVGESLTVEVTFPNDYSNTELSGKDATFDVVINGYYSDELTDEVVQANLSEFAQTAEEYIAYVKKEEIDKKLATYLNDYFNNNTTVNSYPEKYVKQIKSLNKHQALSELSYYQQYYASIGYGNVSFESYFGKTEEEFDKSLDSTAKESVKNALIYQAIAEKEGIVVTDADLEGEDYVSQIQQYGKPSVAQGALFNKVLEFVKENAIIL